MASPSIGSRATRSMLTPWFKWQIHNFHYIFNSYDSPTTHGELYYPNVYESDRTELITRVLQDILGDVYGKTNKKHIKSLRQLEVYNSFPKLYDSLMDTDNQSKFELARELLTPSQIDEIQKYIDVKYPDTESVYGWNVSPFGKYYASDEYPSEWQNLADKGELCYVTIVNTWDPLDRNLYGTLLNMFEKEYGK